MPSLQQVQLLLGRADGYVGGCRVARRSAGLDKIVGLLWMPWKSTDPTIGWTGSVNCWRSAARGRERCQCSGSPGALWTRE